VEGRRWGDYELLEQLGRGSTATVYRARAAAGDEVALKLPRDRLEEEEVKRLLREGRLAARVKHPGVVGVREVGSHEGVPFVALELVEGGRSLDQVWKDWDGARRVQAVLEVAQAVAAIHAEGLVHRDLKPANVLLGADGRARVADFGLSWHPDLVSLTQSRAFLGTPLYMAPEVWSAPGKEPRRNPAVDVWALGVLLYEALTSVHPYGEGVADTLALMRRLQRRLPPPRELQPGVSPSLEAVCLRALSPKPDQRYPDGAALLAALEQALEEAAAPTVSQPGRLQWLLVALAATLAVVLGTIVILLTGRPGPSVVGPPAGTPTASSGPVDSGAATGRAQEPPDEPVAPLPARPSPPSEPEPPRSEPRPSRPPVGGTRGAVGSIWAEPNPVPAPRGTRGTVTLRWSTARLEDEGASVWVFAHDAREGSLFSSSASATEQAPWILPGRTYTFRLYAGHDTSAPLLDEVVVRGVLAELKPDEGAR
jgi:serine/threonine-protein kinase